MTHTTDPEAPTDEDYLSALLALRLSDAADAAIDNIYQCRSQAIPVFKRLWKLMEAEIVKCHPHVRQRAHDSTVSHLLLCGRSMDDAIRELLCCGHHVYLEDISDLEISSNSPRFRGRLRDFELAHIHGANDVKRLKEQLLRNCPGQNERDAIRRRWTSPYDADEPVLAQVIALDRARARQ